MISGIIIAGVFLWFLISGNLFRLSAGTTNEPAILYVNQGNGVVNTSNFGAMLTLAKSHGFNTVFFQVYRAGNLLFNMSELHSFVTGAHSEGIKIFFAVYFTTPSQEMPVSIYDLGEDGISLDMSTLPISSQGTLLSALQAGFHAGRTAITTTDVNLTLKPDLLVLETYGVESRTFIKHGTVGSVGVFATVSKADYEQQFEYALNNSDGVMVFDYAGLVKSGY